MRDRLQALAAVRKMTVAALVRKAVVALLDDEPGGADIACNSTPTTSRGRVIKVTLRLSANHAAALATRARAADVSQGAYVAGLIDGMLPNPLPPDHTQAVAALVGSTNQVAAMSADLNAFMRLQVRDSTTEIQRYRAGILSLTDDVRSHLAMAAALVAELRSARRP